MYEKLFTAYLKNNLCKKKENIREEEKKEKMYLEEVRQGGWLEEEAKGES